MNNICIDAYIWFQRHILLLPCPLLFQSFKITVSLSPQAVSFSQVSSRSCKFGILAPAEFVLGRVTFMFVYVL